MRDLIAIAGFFALLWVGMLAVSERADMRAAELYADCVVGCDLQPITVEVTWIP
jgi:hypothetical protein